MRTLTIYFIVSCLPYVTSAVDLGDGYGFPSSHSQWMGYFASFLVLHFTLRHRFIPTGSILLDWARDIFLFTFIISWSLGVAYSRCVLML